ncbi:MAG: DUF2855 family protein [Alphaproteobacteria bacterium]|nr:DUF2855 family protein [Alphaproteobacteria bacterium]
MTDTSAQATDFLVSKNELSETCFKMHGMPEIDEGEVLFKLNHFAFTANNITYAAFGDAMKYWQFFPAPSGYGRIPVWGFGDVVASKHADVAVGERFYGYFPMSSHLVVRPGKVSPSGFSDSAEHRKDLAAIYNQYVNVAHDPGYKKDMEDLQMIFRPLFTTSFLIDDFLADNDFFGASQIVLSSASSKTAFGAAFQLANRRGIKVIGLTSAGNKAFVEGLGCYDTVVCYDEIDSLDATKTTAYVDMAGSTAVRRSVHSHFAGNLSYSCAVGASHWEDRGAQEELPGAKPTLFFAPAQGQKRVGDWGPDGFQQKVAAAWASFIGPASGWITIDRQNGESCILAVYQEMLSGNTKPTTGYILGF